MFAKLKIVLHKIDFFGKTLMFEENESQKHNTKIGVFTTILLVIVCSVIGVLFGKEIYERKNPTVISSNQIRQYSRIATDEYPVFFSFADYNGQEIENIEEIFDFTYLIYSMDDKLASTANLLPISMTKNCNSSIFKAPYKEMVDQLYILQSKNSKSTYAHCLHKDGLFFQNSLVSVNSTLIEVIMSKCNPLMKKCNPNLNKIIDNMYISVVTFDAFVDPNNYTNPIVYYSNIFTQLVTSSMMKRNIINTEIASLVTHRGWLLEDIDTVEYYTRKEIIRDVNSSEDGSIYRVGFISNQLVTKDIRTYMKIQDLLAKIGGFFNSLLILCLLLIKDYVDYDYYCSIYSHIKSTSLENNKNCLFEKSKNNNIFKDKTSLEENKILHDNEDKFIKNLTSNNKPSDKINNYIKTSSNNNIKDIADMNSKNCLNNDSINNFIPSNNLNSVENPNSKVINLLTHNAFQIKSIGVDAENSANLIKSNNSLERNLDVLNQFKTEDNVSNNYLAYFCNDYICCKKTKAYKIKAVKKVLSYNNVIKMSFDQYFNLKS